MLLFLFSKHSCSPKISMFLQKKIYKSVHSCIPTWIHLRMFSNKRRDMTLQHKQHRNCYIKIKLYLNLAIFYEESNLLKLLSEPLERLITCPLLFVKICLCALYTHTQSKTIKYSFRHSDVSLLSRSLEYVSIQ